MNTWRRSLLAGYSLLTVALLGVLAALAWNQSRQLDIDLGGFRMTAGVLAGDAEKILFTLLAGMLALFALATFAIAVAPDEQRKARRLRTRDANGLVVELEAGTLESVVNRELARLPDVRGVTSTVAFVGPVVETEIAVDVGSGANLKALTGAVHHTYAAALQEAFGLRNLPPPTILVGEPGPSEDPGGAPLRAPVFDAPPMPKSYRQLARPNDGNLEFPYD